MWARRRLALKLAPSRAAHNPHQSYKNNISQLRIWQVNIPTLSTLLRSFSVVITSYTHDDINKVIFANREMSLKVCISY